MEADTVEAFRKQEGVTNSIADWPLQFISGEFQRPKLSVLYTLSLIAAALAMVLIPILYLLLIGLIGHAVYFHAAQLCKFSDTETSRFIDVLFSLSPHLLVIFLGSILIFSLTKPFLAQTRDEVTGTTLNPGDAPQFFTLLRWICQAIRAPMPDRVQLNLSTTAAGGFSGGFASFFRNETVLVIGLPLIAGMNLGQFVSVIAHEYGHFSQGIAMRASYIITRINLWFYNAVHTRDLWDNYLLAASQDESQSFLIVLVLCFSRAVVWIGRRILWLFMVIGQAISCLLSRQMEYNADLHAIQMSGSETFILSLQRLLQLDLAAALSEQQAAGKWKKEQRLFDRFPEFITSRADDISAEVQDQIHARGKQRRSLFDLHPSTAQRTERAKLANARGIFHCTTPATSVFAHFPELSRKMTIAFYQTLIGPDFKPEWLVATEQLTRQADHDYQADQQGLQRFFHGMATSLRPIIITENKSLVFRSREKLISSIKESRQYMHNSLSTAGAAYNALKDADDRLLRALQARHLSDVGCNFAPEDFGVAGLDVNAAVDNAQEEFNAATNYYKPFEDAGRVRINDAIQLLRLPQVTATIPDGVKLQDQAKQMIWTLSRLGEVFDKILELRKDCAVLEILLHYRQEQADAESLAPEIETISIGIQESINQLQTKLSQVRYPFHHTTEDAFVSDYARNTEYHPTPSQLLLLEGRSHVEKLVALYQRLLSNLIMICEIVEQHAVDQ
jgi:Zn-dependent protease with chaperone function